MPVIWDYSTRIIHWGIALMVVLNLFVVEEGDDLHQWFGYAAVGFVVWRLIWGFKGGVLSRFSAFPVKDLKNTFRKKYEGHNPLASLTYYSLWLSIIGLAITGYMMGMDRFWGDDLLLEIHDYISIFLQALIITHFVGIILDAIKYKRKTWIGMITGRKG
jgi:cytochrome b